MCSHENISYIAEESDSARQSLDESDVTGRYLFFSRDFSLCLLVMSLMEFTDVQNTDLVN